MSSFVGINTMPTHEQTTTDNLKPSRHCDKCKCDCPFGGAAAVMVPRAATKLPVFVVAGTVRLSDSTVAFASAIRNHALARGPPQFS